MEKILYSAYETAKILKRSKAETYRIIEAGLLKTIKMGRATWVIGSSIPEMLEKYAGCDLSDPYDIKKIDHSSIMKMKEGESM